MATSKNFIESYATSQETSQAEAKRVMDAVEDAFKSHLATMKPGDKFTFCGLIVDVFEVPARVGQSYLTGTTWHKDAHNGIKIRVPNSVKNCILD